LLVCAKPGAPQAINSKTAMKRKVVGSMGPP
jgi:hypothetical protein